jgi:hypothetical protein
MKGDDDNPIRFGSGVVTLLDPKRGAERSFNRYYERERFFATVMLGPGVLSGKRFVAGRREKAQRRIFDASLDPERGSFLNMYWVLGDGKELEEWTPGQVERLQAEGRTNWDRVPYWAYRPQLEWSVSGPPDTIPAVLALLHGYKGLVMAIARPSSPAEFDEASAWYRAACAPGTIDGRSPARLCVAFRAHRRFVPRTPGDLPPAGFSSDEVQLLLFWFLEDEPGESWTAIADCHEERLAATHLLTPVWMSPFVATVPGTDRYMDSLWLTP